MRAILLAAAAAIWAGNAGAVTLKLSYQTTSSWVTPSYPDYTDDEVFEGEFFGGYFLLENVDLVPNTETVSSNWGNFFITSGDARFQPDWYGPKFKLLYGVSILQNGMIIPYFSLLEYFHTGIYIGGSYSEYMTIDGDYAYNVGSWTVEQIEEMSPVPLPATAPLLLAAIAGSLAIRRKRQEVVMPKDAA